MVHVEPKLYSIIHTIAVLTAIPQLLAMSMHTLVFLLPGRLFQLSQDRNKEK